MYYLVAMYFTLLLIKMFGGLDSVGWSWFYLGPLWLLLYSTVYFLFRFIIVPLIIVSSLIFLVWLIMELGMMPNEPYH